MFRSASFLYVLVVAGMIAINVSDAAGPLAARGASALFKARINIGHSAISHNKRQAGTIPDVPPQCQSDCDPVNIVLANDQCQASTCCQTSFEMNYFNCFKCVAGLANVTDFTTPQQIIDTLVDECAASGFALTKLTFPGQNPNRVLSSVVSTKALTSAPVSLPQTSNSVPATISQSTVTSVPTASSAISQSTVTALPSSTAPSTAGSSTPPANTSAGMKAADSRLAFVLATALLGASFCFSL